VEPAYGAGTVRCHRAHGPIFQGRFKQLPDYGEAQRALVYQRLERMDRELNGHQFVARDRFTIADITALVAIDIGGRLADIKIAPKLAYLTRWHELDYRFRESCHKRGIHLSFQAPICAGALRTKD